jgi:hypothetical protein
MTGMLVIQHLVVLMGVVVLGPMVLFCFVPSVVRVRFEAGPEGVDVGAPQASLELIAELKRLGFQALGTKVEQMPLRPAVHERAFVASDRRCYASVAGSARRPRLYYYTPLPEGGFVLTSNGAFPKIAAAKVAQRSYGGTSPQQLLELHHQALELLGRRGEVEPTCEARVAATYSYYRTPEVRRILRRAGVFALASTSLVAWLLIR